MTIHIGKFELENPFFLAPMAGITDSPFRRIMRRRKASLTISELLSATAIHYDNEQTCEMAEFEEEERPIGLQIYGSECDLLCRAAQFAQRQGADFVDLNLGCSVPKVVKKGGGAALARDVKKLAHILESLVRSVQIPVTIKIRLGWDENSHTAAEIIQAATDSGIMWVTVHGRTSNQGYSGLANWEKIGELKQKSSIPIIGNGDIIHPEMAVDFLKKYGVDGIMIGRFAPRNPFIFEQCHSLWCGETYHIPTCQDYFQLLSEHRQTLEKIYDPDYATIFIRKYLIWYTTGFSGCHRFRAEIFRIKNWEEIWKFAQDFFSVLEHTGDWKLRVVPKLLEEES